MQLETYLQGFAVMFSGFFFYEVKREIKRESTKPSSHIHGNLLCPICICWLSQDNVPSGLYPACAPGAVK